MSTGRRIEVGLVLQGGGALGAYEWGAVTALLELMDEAQERGHEVDLKAVTGVSIGAINAACIVGSKDRKDARQRLRALWEDLRHDLATWLPRRLQRDVALFGLPGFYTPRADWWASPWWTHFYNTEPLLDTLSRHVDFAALQESDTACIFTAVNVDTGELERFRNTSAAIIDHGVDKELRFGNRLRQDRKSAERINRLIELIDTLADLVPEQSYSPEIQGRVRRARLFKVVKLLDVDMQDPLAGEEPLEQDPADDRDGARDFSPRTVERRYRVRRGFARQRLAPAFG